MCRPHRLWAGLQQLGLGLPGRGRRGGFSSGDGSGGSSALLRFQACTEVELCFHSNNVTDMFPPASWGEEQRRDYCSRRWSVLPRPRWLQTQFWGDGEQQQANC